MSASMCNKTTARFLEEYRELPALWQVRSTEHSNRGQRDETWHDAHLNFLKKNVDSIRASFRILKCTRKVGSELMPGSQVKLAQPYRDTFTYFTFFFTQFTALREVKTPP